MSDKELIHFFKNVIINLGHYDWNIKFCNDNYCWFHNKTINIDKRYKGDIRQIILHEIAHIGTAKYCNQKHNPEFWKHLEYLTRKFLKKDLDQQQINHKKFISNGIYRKWKK